jgi:hypothetical protein
MRNRIRETFLGPSLLSGKGNRNSPGRIYFYIKEKEVTTPIQEKRRKNEAGKYSPPAQRRRKKKEMIPLPAPIRKKEGVCRE